MCGIVGYIGVEDTAPILIDGLKKLEYRGYDSAGISVFENGKIVTVKARGRLSVVEEMLKSMKRPLKVHCGIGHTRWATHGEPSDINSHPHGSDRLSLVHNGIIENYIPLKEKLLKRGYSFESDTDTEVAAKLIDYYYQGDPLQAIIDATSKIRGSYALGILFLDFPDRIFAVRKDSPLIVGLSEKGNFIASDIPAILKHTKRYYLLDADEIAVIKKGGVEVFNTEKEPVEKTEMTATWDLESAEKGGYPHFMLKEIYEQPKALRNTMSPRIENGIPVFENISDEELKSIKRLIIIGCGTASYAGLVGKYAVERLARIPVIVELGSEFRYRDPIFMEGDAVLTITQSGETADSLAAQRLAKSAGIRTIAVANVVGSSIPREADHVIYTWAGPEIAVASTKAYSVQLSVMYMLAIKLAFLNGRLMAEDARRLTDDLMGTIDIQKACLEKAADIQHIASIFQNTGDLFFIGRGLDYALTQEGSLKLKEISYIHSEAYAAGELKHGTISLITNGTPVIAIATKAELYEKTVSNIKEVKARGAKVILICTDDMPDIDQIGDYAILIPKMNDLFTAIPGVAILQLFAYYTALSRGCDVDKPRNLAKSVTVE